MFTWCPIVDLSTNVDSKISNGLITSAGLAR